MAVKRATFLARKEHYNYLLAAIFLFIFVIVTLILSRRVNDWTRHWTKASESIISYDSYILPVLKDWMSRQQADGNFMDPLEKKPIPHEQYGETSLGATLIWYGTNFNDSQMIDSGLKAFSHYSQNQVEGHEPFNGLGLAYGYSLLQTQPNTEALKLVKSISQIRNYRGIKTPPIAGMTYNHNWDLVEAAYVSELAKSGLKTNADGTYISDNVELWSSYYNSLIGGDYRQRGIVDGGYTGDIGTWPSAYHAFAAAMLSIYIQNQPNPSPDLVDTFLQITEVTKKLLGPDGDIAYYGRSNQESFSQAAVSLAFETAAYYQKQRGNIQEANEYRSLAYLSFRRLMRLYDARNQGDFIAIIPSLESKFDRSQLDYYANLPTYNGLTLMLLAKAADIAKKTNLPINSYDPNDFKLQSSFFSTPGLAILANNSVWVAIARGNLKNVDGRYTTGIIRYKVRRENDWVDMVPTPSLSLTADELPHALIGETTKYWAVPKNMSANSTTATIDYGFSSSLPNINISDSMRLKYIIDGDSINVNIEASNNLSQITLPLRFKSHIQSGPKGCNQGLQDESLTAITHMELIDRSMVTTTTGSSSDSFSSRAMLTIFTPYLNRKLSLLPTNKVTDNGDCIVLFWGTTDKDTRMGIEKRYGISWVGHAGLPMSMSLDTARTSGLIGRNYWPSYALYQPNAAAESLMKKDNLKWLVNQEAQQYLPLYFGNLPVATRKNLETAYKLKFVFHSGLPGTLALGRQAGLLGPRAYPAVTYYQSNTAVLSINALKPYLKLTR